MFDGAIGDQCLVEMWSGYAFKSVFVPLFCLRSGIGLPDFIYVTWLLNSS